MMRCALIALAASLALPGMAFGTESPGRDMVEAKITLPNGESYTRGTTNPVDDLVVKLVLTNRTKPSSPPPSQNVGSYNYTYAEPALGPHDIVDLQIFRIPEEGEAAKAPILIKRSVDGGILQPADLKETQFLEAGKSSPEYNLQAGHFYNVLEPGKYKVKAILTGIADSTKPSGHAESNEESFTVVPFKSVPLKIEDLKKDWEAYERGYPPFPFMIYLLPTSGEHREIFYVKKIVVHGLNQWDWYRLCSVAPGTTPQVKQMSTTKFAIASIQTKGDAALYTLDFSAYTPALTCTPVKVEGGKIGALTVEGDKAEVK